MGLKRWYATIRQRKLTIKVIPDTGTSSTRDYVVSLRTALLSKIAGVLLLLVLALGIAAMVYSANARERLERLRITNAQLQREVRQVTDLREKLAEIWIINERLKRMLGGGTVLKDKSRSGRSLPWGSPLSSSVGPAFRVEPTRNPELGVYLNTAPGTLVLATGPGKALDVRWSPANGDMLIIDHGGGLQTRYAKDLTIFAQPGDVVLQGQTIGVINPNDGGRSPLLFYQVTLDGQSVNPLESLLSLSTGAAAASRP